MSVAYTVRIIDRLLRFDTTHDDVVVTLLPFVQTPNAPFEIHKISAGDGHTVTIRVDPSTSDFLLPNGSTAIVLNDDSSSALIRIPADGASPAFVTTSGGGTTGGGGGTDPGAPFNVLSVTASEVGPKYQDEKAGLHTVIGVVPVIDIDYSSPRTVTLWFDFGDGVIVWQKYYALTHAGQVIRIGDPVLNTPGVRRSGDIYVPANVSQGSWKVWCAPNKVEDGVSPTGYPSASFTVVPLGACLPGGTTAASFLPDPDTGDPITYSLYYPGGWFWEYFALSFTPPNIATDPNYWQTLITVQKGAMIGGVWTPAPDSEGVNEDAPHMRFLGRKHAEILQIPGLANDQISVITKKGAHPSTWNIPPAENKDLSPNPYIDFRFWLYNVSRLGTDPSGSGGDGTYTLQTSCWAGGADHGTLRPVPHVGDFDFRAANPATIVAPLTGGNGLPLTLLPGTDPGAIDGSYLKDESVHAQHMAADSITVANDALGFEAVIDEKIKTLGINKVTYGVSIFAGDVVLTRGVGSPVIYLKNTTSGPDPAQNPTGIYLFGQGDGTTGTTGLTTKPYVVVKSTAIGLFQGGATGGSIFLDAAANAITIYNKNGDLTAPYLTVGSLFLSFVNGVCSFTVNSNGMVFLDKGNGNRLDTSSAGITIAHGLNPDGSVASSANKLLIMANQMQFMVGVSSRFTIDASLGITTLSDGGANSVVLKSTGITLTTTGGGQTVMDSTGTRSISGTQCVRNAGGIGVQLWAKWNETTQVGDTTQPFIGLEASTGNVYVGSNAHLLTLSGGQMTFAITGAGPTTVITNDSIATGQAGVVPFVLTCDFYSTAGTLAGYRKETVNGTVYKVPLYNL